MPEDSITEKFQILCPYPVLQGIPNPRSILTNYLLQEPYIFDLAEAKERADKRDIERQP